MQTTSVLSAVVLSVLLAACDNDSEDTPYLEFVGSGFGINYEIAKTYYGIIARVKREIPSGAIIEARFENPSGGEELVVTQTAEQDLLYYEFRSPPVQEVRTDQDYQVELRLLNPADKQTIASYSNTFRLTTNQSQLLKHSYREFRFPKSHD